MNTPLEALERLKADAKCLDAGGSFNRDGAINHAADLRSLLSSYEAQGERLREVEGALEPFAEAARLALISGRPPGEHVDANRFLDAAALTQPPAMEKTDA